MTSEQYDILLAQCAPHPVFSSDWLTFTDAEFADALLPDAGLVKGTNLYFYDGAELLPKGCRFPKRLMRLPDGKAPLIAMYSYPKEVKAAQRRERVQPQDNELLLFAEIDKSGKIDMYLNAGESLGKTIEQLSGLQGISPSYIVWGKAMRTSETEFMGYFEKEFSHYMVMRYVGELLGIDLVATDSMNDTILKKAEWQAEDGKAIDGGLTHGIRYGEKVRLSLKFKGTTTKRIKITVGPVGEDGKGFSAEYKRLVFDVALERGKAATPLFTIPFEWYDETKERYDYIEHYIFVPDADQVKIGARVETGKIGFYVSTRPTPYTYRRNYEELVGLSEIQMVEKNKTQGEKSQETTENLSSFFTHKYKDTKLPRLLPPYKPCENFYINKNIEIGRLCDSFAEFMKSDNAAGIDKIEERVLKDTRLLWELAVKQGKTDSPDDRPLYWARIKMQVALKRNPIFKNQIDMSRSIVRKDTELDRIIKTFENLSRNYTGIDFSLAPDGRKKVLLMGFDPYMLDGNVYSKSAPMRFNPSGLLALQLHGETVGNAYIQSCIFPVRYEDFDNGVVEEVMKHHAAEADVIISTSLNGREPEWNIEKYAISYRGGGRDNMNIGNDKELINYPSDDSRFISNDNKDFAETTLPEGKLFNEPFSFRDKENQEIEVELSFNEKWSDTEGSGGNYLSNEIMYRTTKYRDDNDMDEKLIGHVHIGKYNNIEENVDAKEIMEEIIRRITNE